MILSLLSNINVASLAARLSTNKEVAETIYTPAGYNTWVQELANPASELNALKEGIVFLLLDGTELLGDEGMESEDAGKSTLLPYLDLIESYTKAHPEFFFFRLYAGYTAAQTSTASIRAHGTGHMYLLAAGT